jgi:hypothetical protein
VNIKVMDQSAQHSAVLEQLCDPDTLSVLRIRESVFSENQSVEKRQSDVSTTSDGYENATPASLEADLKHYKVGRALEPTAIND